MRVSLPVGDTVMMDSDNCDDFGAMKPEVGISPSAIRRLQTEEAKKRFERVKVCGQQG